MNQADTAAVRGALLQQGFREASAPEDADLIIVNTCTVTHRADQGARQQIRKLKSLSPDSKLVVTGCYAERDAKLLATMPEVDQVFGLSQKKELHQFVTGHVPANLDFGGFDVENHYGEKSRAFLKVQEGCDMRCTYCVIRLVRGKSRSLDLDEIITRLQKLKMAGYSEVVITGIHLGLWGKDLGLKGVGKGMFELLSAIDLAEDMPKVRLNSLEPYVLKDETLELIARSTKFCKHLHLSIQSGSENILRAMKRRPDVKQMYDVVEKARKLMPLCGIGADIIVGFPGETDEDFEATYDLMTKAPFTYGHVFAFSPRPGTEAADMKNLVDSQVIKERSARLRAAIAEKNRQFRESLIGKKTTAVVLQQVDEQGRQVVLTDNFLHTVLDDNIPVPETGVLKVEITSVEDDITCVKLID